MANKDHVRIRLKGANEVISQLNLHDQRVYSAVERIIKKYLLKIERTAKKLAPVDTGRLRSSIRWELKKLAGAVLTDVHYAPFQEFGTGRRGAASGVDVPKGYAYGGSRGIPANSFMRPALDRHKKGFIREIKAIGKTFG